jgi:predicted lipase
MIKFAGHIIEVEKLFSKTENKSKFVKVSQAEQKVNTQAAQQFIEQRIGNPKFQTVQDFYYEAQRMGLPQDVMNSVAELAKKQGFKDLTPKSN